jgi:hypothetical protein
MRPTFATLSRYKSMKPNVLKFVLAHNFTIMLFNVPSYHLFRLTHATWPLTRIRCFSTRRCTKYSWLLLSDLHLHERTIPRLTSFFRNHFFPYFALHKPSQVLILGDIFHHRNGTDQTYHRIFTDWLQELVSAAWKPQVHLLVGNQ